ncbi:MAG: DUF1592 domain-containing protein [Pirellulaceae bacterium]
MSTRPISPRPISLRSAPPIVGLTLLAAISQAATLTADDATGPKFASDAYTKQVVPLLSKYCSKCHGIHREEGELALHLFPNVESVMDHRERWGEISEMIDFGAMPPEDEPQPKPEERQLIVDWLHSVLSYDCSRQKEPGAVTLRRLNRTEYDNTIRDLLGLDLKLAQDFPSDDVGEGFDNIGDVLSLPPLLFEKYVDAARVAAETAIVSDATSLKKQDPNEMPASHRRIVIAIPSKDLKPSQAARRVLERFTSLAYRRPVTQSELDRLVKLVEWVMSKGESYERGLQVAVSTVLVSPHFLFRVEPDPEDNHASPIRRLNDYELASRLSYFLWSSMPDEELFRIAEQGKLQRDDLLQGQVRRMLADPKAQALVKNFGGQWLNLRMLEDVTPDPKRFAAFGDSVRNDMRRETEMFFETIMREDRSIVDFLTGEFTFLNQRLAEYYGMEGVQGDNFRRVALTGGRRIGVLTHASILTLTSNPTRTSPVKRGKWILENILGTVPPEPPPNVPPLDATREASPHATVREQMVLHREDPVCASCHRQMDDLGFGFENFDAIGRWREQDAGQPINAAGELPSGETFSGPAQLVDILGKRQEAFSRALARKMLVYALGRGLKPYDQCAIDATVKDLKQNEYRFSTLVTSIVTSTPFRMRRISGGE